MSSQRIGSPRLPESGQNSMLTPLHSGHSLLAADWQIRPLLPSDSLEQLTDLIHRAYAPHLTHGLRKFGCLNCPALRMQTTVGRPTQWPDPRIPQPLQR